MWSSLFFLSNCAKYIIPWAYVCMCVLGSIWKISLILSTRAIICTAFQMAETLYSTFIFYQTNYNLFVNWKLILLKNKIVLYFIPHFSLSAYSPYLPNLCIVQHSLCSSYEFTEISANFFLINSNFNLKSTMYVDVNSYMYALIWNIL